MNRKIYILGLLFAGASAFAQTSDANNTFYVKQGASTASSAGNSWTNAHGSLGDVLVAAKAITDKNGAAKIYISKGTYAPTRNLDYKAEGNTKDHTFRIPNNVEIYGGFDPEGGITTLERRNFSDSTATIFDGNKKHYHMIVMKDGNVGKVDGVSITGGDAFSDSDANGGISRKYAGAISTDNASITISNVKAYKNYGQDRAGAFHFESKGTINIINTLLYDNLSDGDGSAIFAINKDVKVNIINSTIVKNLSRTDGNGGAVHVSSDANYFIYNSIIWNNTRNGNRIVALTGGDISDFEIEYSILNDNTENFSGDQYGRKILHYDPQFVNYDGNDFRLKSTSSAINGGNQSKFTYGNTDLSGNARINSSSIDIGAYENQNPLLVTNASKIIYVDKNVVGGTGSGDSWTNAIKEVSDVLQYTNIRTLAKSLSRDTFDGVDIYVAKGEYSPAYSPENFSKASDNTQNSFLLSKNVKLYGGFDPAKNSTTLTQRDVTKNHSVLKGNDHRHVVIAAGDNSSNGLLDGFHISDGNASGGNNVNVNGQSLNPKFGGGMMIQGAQVVLKNMIVRDNKAKERGAGIYVENGAGKLTISNSIIADNIAGDGNTGEGSGIYLNSGGQAIVINTTVANNLTTNTSGGGALHVKDNGKFKIYNSIVWNNKNRDASPKLLNLTGGDDADFEVYNSIVNANSNPDGINGDGHNNGENGGKINYFTHNPMFIDDKSDYTLKPLSPAINQGNNANYAISGNSTDDIDMVSKKRLIGTNIDLGAFENQTPVQPDADNILYVSKSATGTGVGNTWDNAITELGDALKWAYQQNSANGFSSTNPLKIYVANGSYEPLYRPTDLEAGDDSRERTFLMPKNVHVYGSFDLNNKDINKRNILEGDKSILKANTNYHLVVAAGEESSNSKLDGFQIQDGVANGSGSLKVNNHDIDRDKGAGVYVVNRDDSKTTKLVLKNIIAKNNVAKDRGGFLNADKKGTFVNLVNALVYDNKITNGGDGGSAIFSNNDAKVVILNSTIANNKNDASNGGAVHVREEGSFDIYNSIIWNNYNKNNDLANMTGGEDNDFIVSNSIMNLDGNKGEDEHKNGDNSGKINFLTYNPQFVDAAKRDYRLVTGSNPAVNQGSNARYIDASQSSTALVDFDITGRPRLEGQIDMGAIENENPYTVDAANTLYVKKGATGNGSAWGNEISEVADALRWAKHRINLGGILKIKVAKGTYFPMYNPIDFEKTSDKKDETFLMVNNVHLYGGYDPSTGKTSDADVNVKNNPTILSGNDINHHVILSAGDKNSDKAVFGKIDGFVITQGAANGSNDITVNNSGINRHYGAGVYADNARLKINNSIFRNNKSIFNNDGRAGAIYAEANSDISIVNSLIHNNEVDAEGSAIFAKDGDTAVEIINTTIADNKTTAGGDSGALHMTNNSDYYIYNSIVWNNKNKDGFANLTGGDSEDNGWNVYHSIINRKSNLSTGSDGHNDGENGGRINFKSYDPKFVDPSKGDYSLQPSSPAIDSGDRTLYDTNGLGSTIDIYGNTRVKEGNIDMGALEVQKSISKVLGQALFVNSSVSGGNQSGDSWANAMPNLADALQWILRTKTSYTANDPLKIYLGKGIQNPMYSSYANNHRNSDGRPHGDNSNERIDSDYEADINGDARNHSFVIPNNVHIYGNYVGSGSTSKNQQIGNGISETILSGLANQSRHVVVAASKNGGAVEARLENVVIQDGDASGSGDLDGLNHNYGGAVYVEKAKLFLKNVVARNNKSNERGGAFYAEDNGSIIVSNSIVHNNNSNGDGSAMYSNDNSTINVINSTVANNTSATSGNGGALHVKDNGKFNVVNSILWNNKRNDNKLSNLSGGSDNDFNVTNTIMNMASTDHGGSSIDVINDDPKFTNEGLADYSLDKSSPAINRGNTQSYIAASGNVNSANDNDILGNNRVVGLSIDLGAIESDTSLNVIDGEVKKSTKVYPNPTTGIFYIDSPEQETVMIFNIAGQFVKSVNLKAGKNTVDITTLPVGLYILKAKMSSHKIIKK